MRRLLTLLLLVFAPNASGAEGFGANDAAFLNLMGELEAPGGFGDVFDGAPLLPPEQLESMTIGEVLTYQRQIRRLGTRSSAVGRYQFIYPTLSRLTSELSISEQIVFDSEVQTFLARTLMASCGFYDPDQNLFELADCLAEVWAALPETTGPHRGQSAYWQDGLNRALVRPEAVLDVLEARFAS